MGDDLPGFHGELKSIRGVSAPAFDGFEFGELIEARIDLDAGECAEVRALRQCKTAAPDADLSVWFGDHENILPSPFMLEKHLQRLYDVKQEVMHG